MAVFGRWARRNSRSSNADATALRFFAERDERLISDDDDDDDDVDDDDEEDDDDDVDSDGNGDDCWSRSCFRSRS